MKASDLKPNPENPRTITDEQLAVLRAAMREFGDISGLIRNMTTGNLVGGHQRVKILGDLPVKVVRRYKQPTVQGTIAEGYVTFEGERFTYREVKWDIAKEKSAMIAANKLGGDWEKDKLNELLKSLADESPNGDESDVDWLSLTGFDKDDINEPVGPNEEVIYEQGIQLRPGKEYIVIVCEPEQFEELKSRFNLRKVRRGGYKVGSPYDDLGIERVIDYKRFIKHANSSSE
jgi:hypothetical protein